MDRPKSSGLQAAKRSSLQVFSLKNAFCCIAKTFLWLQKIITKEVGVHFKLPWSQHVLHLAYTSYTSRPCGVQWPIQCPYLQFVYMFDSFIHAANWLPTQRGFLTERSTVYRLYNPNAALPSTNQRTRSSIRNIWVKHTLVMYQPSLSWRWRIRQVVITKKWLEKSPEWDV